MTAVSRRTIRARARFAAMLVAGAVAGLAVGALDSWLRALAAGWAAAAVVYDAWMWIDMARMDADRTRAHAVSLDPGRAARELLVLGANLASLAAVVLLVADTSRAVGAARLGYGLLALLTVAASWLLVQTLFTQRYADAYYRSDPPGGIGFNQQQPPDFLDFAYMAFSLGMTYQISDNTIETSAIRRIALVHSLIAFVFGIGILATSISLVTGLVTS